MKTSLSPAPRRTLAPRALLPLLGLLGWLGALARPGGGEPSTPPDAVALERVVLVSGGGMGPERADASVLGGNVVGGNLLGGEFLSNVLGQSILGRVGDEPLDDALAFR